MKLVVVNEMPKMRKRCEKHELQLLISDFMKGDDNVVRVAYTDTDYSTLDSCYNSLHHAIKVSKRRLFVTRVDKEIYLVKL